MRAEIERVLPPLETAAAIDRTRVAGNADGNVRGAVHDMRVQAKRFDETDDTANLRLSRAGIHHDKHVC